MSGMKDEVVYPEGADPQLINDDIAPLKEQKWGAYNIFAFWMSDVHSVGGYTTAGALFAMGLTSWQVLLALLVGIFIVYFACNLVSLPSQRSGTPFAVVCRAAFGIQGAKIPALIRGCIAVAWYGIQTYLASHALVILMVKLQPDWAEWADKDLHGFLGLSVLGYIAFAILWVVQALVFWRGMESIRKFIDFCGPAVYIVMAVLAIYLVSEAGWDNVNLNLSDHRLTGFAVFSTFCAAVATTVSYFSGPMLNFGDISRYGKSQKAVKIGNFLGLPLNFLVFSIMVVLTASATVPVYGRMITDPVDTIAELDNTYAIAFGALTLLIATVGINIVANFIAPAFDFSTVAPKMISWRMGGMIAAAGSIFLTPWNLYNSPDTIHYTLDTLAAFIGPVFGVLIAYFYVINRGDLNIPALFDSSPSGAYWYSKGFNVNSVIAICVAAVVGIVIVVVPAFEDAATYTWFIGAILAGVLVILLENIRPSVIMRDATTAAKAQADTARILD
ncbi:NCS1 family nucleobase:cation symporter-1 [Corynebacterium variabile]|uniref:Cytosine/uracil/thiamine/allantoin permeases n=1 Tax=Corynebacterium variabile TaxID=1727 RepID=A0A0X8XVE4_9CORY|nr:NCS1 family nucleobase:cation symporter-1 [Corynebacterium variabile]MDN6814031.1 NCS1 family nucleobase:cation symporter-1 [Corynebacterium variabile]GEC85190.1 nitrate reductase [Corynebacterium variabile]CUU65013.1 Cytosine/uracil/thiamine/allantoin permeases [Corynebacterium variabile]